MPTRGVMQTETGNQDRREPSFQKRRRKRKGKKKGSRRRTGRHRGPLHEAMVRAAT